MKPFDFVFIAAFFFVAGSLTWIAVQWFRSRRTAALRHGRRVAIFVAVYFAVVAVVAIATPQRVLAPGTTQRFDDWCVAVTDATTVGKIDNLAAAPGKFVVVTIRVFSAARRISQAAPHAWADLLGADGKRYGVFGPAQEAYERLHGPQPSMGSRLAPLGSVTTVRAFRVPASLDHVDVVTHHGGGPGAFIIGDDANPLHKPTVVRIPLTQ